MNGFMPNPAYVNMNPMQNQAAFQQQFYTSYLQYCMMNGLNAQDQNNYNKYCQMWMMNNPMMFNTMNMNNNTMNMNNNTMNMNNNQMNMNNNQMNMNNNQMNMNNNQMNMNNNPVNIGGNQSTQSTQNTNQDNFYIQDENKPKEIIPREEKTLYLKPNELKGSNIPPQMAQMANQNLNPFQAFAGMGNDIINVTLNATTGFKVVIPAPKSMTFEDLFINFANKAGVPVSTIGEQIVFLYNAEKLDAKSKQPISSLFKSFNANVTVLDQGGIIGA